MIHYFNQSSSTNSMLRELSRQEMLEEGYTVYVGSQTCGRGQQGNSWESESGKNLTFSLLLCPDFLTSSDHFLISQVVSIAMVDFLSTFDSHFSIKWPNDIYYNDRKIAGILIENDWQSGHIGRSIVGVGLNVNQTVFVSDAPNPISLKQITGVDYLLEDLMLKIHSQLMNEYSLLKEGSFTEILNRYVSKMYRLNELTCFEDREGVFDALVCGVHHDGRLCLQVPEEQFMRFYYFKEVSWRIS